MTGVYFESASLEMFVRRREASHPPQIRALGAGGIRINASLELLPPAPGLAIFLAIFRDIF